MSGSKIDVNKKILLDLAADLPAVVKEKRWVTRYDIECDSLSITKPKLSKDARINYFGDEIAFYITENNAVEGIFVEYFKNNFVKHHKKLAKVLKDVEKNRKNENGYLVKLKPDEFLKISADLEEAIKCSLVSKLSL